MKPSSYEVNKIKLKEVHLVNFPSFAATMVELILNVLGNSVKSRIQVHKNLVNYSDIVDLKILPIEFGGGSVSVSDMIADIKGKLQRSRKEILSSNDIEINSLKFPSWNSTNEEDGVCGSFRKLEVD